jgi:hypothetical protein
MDISPALLSTERIRSEQKMKQSKAMQFLIKYVHL